MRMRGKKAIFNFKDTWSLDLVLSPIISAGLKRFKEVITDPKNEDSVGYPGALHVIAEEDATDDEMRALWVDTLDTMIYAFDAKEPEMPNGMFKHTPNEVEVISGTKYTSTELKVKDEVRFARYKQDRDLHWAKVKEGHALFARFYTSLWW